MLGRQMRDRVAETQYRAREIRANRQLKTGAVVSGGERHLIQLGDGLITSRSFGGVVKMGQTVLVRQDSGQSWFY
jgi:hypothetical protein